MDARSVSGAVESTSWGLNHDHAQRTQGLVVSGFAHLPAGRALFLEQRNAGGGWLDTLKTVAPVTSAQGRIEKRGAAIAFTASGLRAIGVAAEAPPGAPDPFGEGMFQEDRMRRLGDRWKGAWTETVIAGGPLWSGNVQGPAAAPSGGDPLAYTATGHDEEVIATPLTVHALLLLYAEDDADADAWAEEVKAALAGVGVTAVRTLPLELRPDANNVSREHFGFADGISQPVPYDADSEGDARTVVYGDGRAVDPDKWHGVPLGELLFGHVNGHHEAAPGPAFASDATGDLALDGSYMVVRELKQDVAAFWSAMERNAAAIRASDASAAQVTAEWLAERAIGRTRDGALLCPMGSLPIGADDNGFGFHDRDPHGVGCPAGSHVRRGNPRDGLATKPGQQATLLQAANRHRILRRARKFGPGLARGAPDDGADRGLLFIALNTDIQRQFEFVQQTWMLNRNFATLFDESDPLLGPAGPMTVRDQPLRRIVHVDTFVRLAGGEYFFLPSLHALEWLARR